MPLRCLGPNGQSIQSFDLPEAEWSALRLENRRLRQLRMPCCDASVVMRTSTLGLKFFAHKSRGPCQSAPETEAHLALKTLAAQAARRAGWTCATEAGGSSPSGETWTADVLADKGKAKIAIEIQWSPQTNEESLYRQERYRQSGVRCLWLFRGTGFPVSQNFPAACVSGDLTTGFKVHLGGQEMPVDDFLDAVFAKRFCYEIPVGAKAVVRVRSWRRFFTGVVTGEIRYIDVCVGPHRIQLTVPNLENFPDLFASCKEHIPNALSTGLNKPRYKLHTEEDILAEFQIMISGRWVKAIKTTASIYGWGVFAFE
jgi:Competence protein CoiA-like family